MSWLAGFSGYGSTMSRALNQNICGATDTSTGAPCERPVAPGAASCGYHLAKAPIQHAPSRLVLENLARQAATLEMEELLSSEDLSHSQEMWKEFFWDEPKRAADWSSSFPDYDEGMRWHIEGFEDPLQALAWKGHGFGPESHEWADVVGEDNPQAALEWLGIKGMTPSVASPLIDDGVSPQEAQARYGQPVTVAAEAELWQELFFDEPELAAEWAEFSPSYAWGLRWYRRGWSLQQAREWHQHGFNADATEWLDVVGDDGPGEASRWCTIRGMTPREAARCVERGIDPEEVATSRGILISVD